MLQNKLLVCYNISALFVGSIHVLIRLYAVE